MNIFRQILEQEKVQFVSDFNNEFPGLLTRALVVESEDRLCWIWFKVQYPKEDKQRIVAQDVSTEVLEDPERRSDWLAQFFSHVRSDLQGAA